jgi:Protein of unknown function (DUF3108)
MICNTRNIMAFCPPLRRCAWVVLLISLNAYTQGSAPVTTESKTERTTTLQYGVEWRLIRAGHARVDWSPRTEGFQGDLHLESAGLVSKLYKVNDDYRVQMNSELCAQDVFIKAQEGKRNRETKITFGPEKASYLERDLIKNTVALQKETPTPACVHEYLGALNKLRERKLEIGQSTEIPMSDGKKFANVKVEAQEREQVKTPTGTFNAIRHEVFMFNNVLINRKARMFVWVTDDARRLPVQLRVRMQFLIGTITLQLEKEERN